MPSLPLAGLLGSDTIKQILIWQVVGQLFQPFLAPVVQQLQQDVLGKFPDVALSPADVVEAVIKNVDQRIDAKTEAALSGIDADRLATLVDAAGEPPGLETLLEWARREIIPWAGTGAQSVSLEQGVRESRLKDKWNAPIKAAATQVLSPAEAVAAAIRGNLPMAEAEKLAYQAGVSAEDFQTMVHNAGRPPSPGELLELAKRGIIPWDGTGPEVTSFQQGIYEGDTKDKWEPAYRDLGRYIPPPRTITAMLREGAISQAQAEKLLAEQGVEADLIAAYVAGASKGSAAASKELTKAEILQLYREGIVNGPTAVADLQRLGMAEADAQELVSLQDVIRTRQYQTQVTAKIRSLYLGHHITEQQATEALRESGSDQATITHLLTLWGLERQQPEVRLTGAQIASAAYYKALTPEEAYTALQGIGYSAFDAWIILADRLHGTAELPARPPLPDWSG